MTRIPTASPRFELARGWRERSARACKREIAHLHFLHLLCYFAVFSAFKSSYDFFFFKLPPYTSFLTQWHVAARALLPSYFSAGICLGYLLPASISLLHTIFVVLIICIPLDCPTEWTLSGGRQENSVYVISHKKTTYNWIVSVEKKDSKAKVRVFASSNTNDFCTWPRPEHRLFTGSGKRGKKEKVERQQREQIQWTVVRERKWKREKTE